MSNMKIKNHFLNRLKNHISFRLKPTRINIYLEKNNLELAHKISLNPQVDLKNEKAYVALVKDNSGEPYYTKFERFLKNNQISYDYFNIRSSNWIEDVKKFVRFRSRY